MEEEKSRDWMSHAYPFVMVVALSAFVLILVGSFIISLFSSKESASEIIRITKEFLTTLCQSWIILLLLIFPSLYHPIVRLIDRIKKLKAPGVEIDCPGERQPLGQQDRREEG